MTWSANRIGLIPAVAGLAYPGLVYLCIGRVPAGALVLMALALVAARLAVLRHGPAARRLMAPLVAVMAASLGLTLIDPTLAALCYPVVMSLAMAGAFAWSLIRPPSLVEIFARLRHPDPPPAAKAYMRKVSLAWTVFLLFNAANAATTVALGDMEWWALYNGLIAYLLMGALAVGEYLIRPKEGRI
jgi:uncharacterized membrane protein